MTRSGDPAQSTDVTCPFCDSKDVVKDSEFGPEISKSQYYCNSCESPYARMNWGESRRPAIDH